MESLHISTSSMARALHVDASLVSKWKSGERAITGRSNYFDDILAFLLQPDSPIYRKKLNNILHEAFPRQPLRTAADYRVLIGQYLHAQPASRPAAHPSAKIFPAAAQTVPALLYHEESGQRKAIDELLDYADSLDTPCQLTFIDSTEYRWLLEFPEYAEQFTRRLSALLDRGFQARFVLHHSSYHDKSILLFHACSPLIFHRNVEWYYDHYYDEHSFNLSLILLNHSISILQVAATEAASTTMVFTDRSLVLRHDALASNIIANCAPLFENFLPTQFRKVIEDVYHSRRRSAFFSYLPAPAFMSVKVSLLQEILEANLVDQETIQECIALNQKCRESMHNYFSSSQRRKEPFYHIFQLEEMEERAHTEPFISGSLTLLGNKTIRITPQQYAQELRDLADGMLRHENLQVILVSKRDAVTLPAVNCWCKQHSWMIQMDAEGFRVSNELSIISAAAVVFEQCIRQIPPERKEKDSVRSYLLEMADELDEK